MLKLGGLSEAELEKARNAPLLDRKALFLPVEKWHARNKAMLACGYPHARYAVVNALNSAAAVGKDYDEVVQSYKERFGPPPPEGWHFLGRHL